MPPSSMKPELLAMAAVGTLIAASVAASDLLIDSIDRNGNLTWTNTVSNAVYQVQWASAVTGPWTNFQALASLDTISPTGSVTTVAVPVFFRVAAAQPEPTVRPDGVYRYTAFDTNGSLLVVGWWEINSSPPAASGTILIRGTWTMGYTGAMVYNRTTGSTRPSVVGGSCNYDEKTGPQVGVGDLAGSIHKNRLSVGINPNISDGNVGVYGEFDGNKFTGHWLYEGFAGLPLFGTFTLEKVAGLSE